MKLISHPQCLGAGLIIALSHIAAKSTRYKITWCRGKVRSNYMKACRVSSNYNFRHEGDNYLFNMVDNIESNQDHIFAVASICLNITS